MIIQGHQKLLI